MLIFIGDLSHSVAAVSCGDPGTPTHGSRKGSDFTFQQTVHFSCADGYILYGPDSRVCKSSAVWSGRVPKCQPVLCPRISTPAYALRNSSNFTFTSAVAIVCADGFLLVGTSVLVCTASGQWSHAIPSCQPVHCPISLSTLNGLVLRQNTTFSGTLVSGCVHGYVRKSGDFKRTCQADGKWSGLPLICTGNTCVLVVLYTVKPVLWLLFMFVWHLICILFHLPVLLILHCSNFAVTYTRCPLSAFSGLGNNISNGQFLLAKVHSNFVCLCFFVPDFSLFFIKLSAVDNLVLCHMAY